MTVQDCLSGHGHLLHVQNQWLMNSQLYVWMCDTIIIDSQVALI